MYRSTVGRFTTLCQLERAAAVMVVGRLYVPVIPVAVPCEHTE
jgi:hypothetical protein